MLRYGLISEIDAAKGLARVNFNDDGIVSDWLPLTFPSAMEDSFSVFPAINEQVACLMDTHSENGVILGAMYNSETKPNGGSKDKWRVRFSDGTVLEYDKSAHKLTAEVAGDVEVKSTGAVKVDAQGAVDVKTLLVATVKATSVTLDAPAVTVTGVLTVGQLVIAPSGTANGSLDVAGNLTVQGDVSTQGTVSASGEVSGSEVKAGTVALSTHTHLGVQPGGGTSGSPVL